MPWKMKIRKCWGDEQQVYHRGERDHLADGEPEIIRTDSYDMSATFKLEVQPDIWYEVDIEIDVLWQALIRVYRNQGTEQLERYIRQIDGEVDHLSIMKEILEKRVKENDPTSHSS